MEQKLEPDNIPESLLEGTRRIHSESGRLIVLDTSRVLFVVLKGEFDFFILQGEQGTRLPLMSLSSSGETVFTGICPSAGEKIRLAAIARPGTKWLLITEEEADFLCGKEKNTELFFMKGLASFVEKLFEAAEIPVSFSCSEAKSPDHLRNAFQSHALFVYEAFEKFAFRWNEKELRQLEASLYAAEQSRMSSMKKFTMLFFHQELHLPNTGDALADCCSIIGIAEGLSFADEQEKSSDPLEKRLLAICSRSMIRNRTVYLENKWHRTPGQPFLGIRGEDRHPVVLLPDPQNETSWKLYDPVKKEILKVSDGIAAQIDNVATVFYKPFPPGRITYSAIWNMVWNSSKRDILRIVLFMFLASLLASTIPVINAIVFSTVIPMADRRLLIQIFILTVLFALAQGVVEYIYSNAILRIHCRSQWLLQSALWDRVMSLPVNFFRKFSAGDLSSISLGFLSVARNLPMFALKNLLSGVFIVPPLLLMFFYNPALSGLFLLLLGVLVLLYLIFARIQFRYLLAVKKEEGKLDGETIQCMAGINKIRSTKTENQAIEAWSNVYVQKKEKQYYLSCASKIIRLISISLPILSVILMIGFITYQTAKNGKEAMPVADFICFASALSLVCGSMSKIFETTITTLKVIPCFQRMRPIFDAESEFEKNKISPGRLSGEIEIKHVTFRYSPSQRPILQDVSLHISAGEFVAIVGNSGTGKSTLLRLLLGFEKPEQGSIAYDRMDLNKIDLREFRLQLGVVLQTGKLLPDTIYRNIVAGTSSLTIEDAWDAARKAGIAEEIAALPMQMFTLMTNGGFSGGQKQRILIARALVRKPSMIFFDEATSALDNKTQGQVCKSLLGEKATRLVIAHRLSTVIHADRIIVMDNGSIAESGTYQELIGRADSLFLKLVKRQLMEGSGS